MPSFPLHKRKQCCGYKGRNKKFMTVSLGRRIYENFHFFLRLNYTEDGWYCTSLEGNENYTAHVIMRNHATLCSA